MGERLAFLLGKDPATTQGGDMTMFRVMRAIASEQYETEVICLSATAASDDLQRIPKPEVAPVSLARRSLVGRRSLVHTRFDVPGMSRAIERSGADRFVAIHSYMAEPYLRADASDRDLFVSTEVSEAAVWRSSRGMAGRVEARRISRDELRVARAAHAVAGYDRDEVEDYRRRGIANAQWLPLTLPPSDRIDIASTPPRLVVLGTRSWAPNAQAADTIVSWWPEISAGIPGAELWLVGEPASGVRALPDGVTDKGFVDDLDAVLGTCRGLLAPVTVGGGVRVKLLEAAARGLPVVCTPEAIGSIEAALGMTAAADPVAFVAACRALLLDADEAADAGGSLYDANARRWTDRVGHDAVHGWLAS